MSRSERRRTPTLKHVQVYGHRESPYERPNQKWVCGRRADGEPCDRGPSPKGQCRATHECEPARDGDRWICARAQSKGGPCDSGPDPRGTCARSVLPCVPVRSPRALRGWIAYAGVVLSVGLLLVLLGGPLRSTFVSPGELSFQHGAVVDQCTECHTAAHDGPMDWVAAALQPAPSHKESELCQGCHSMGEHGLDPHSVPPGKLGQITKRVEEHAAGSGGADNPALMTLGLEVAKTENGQLACASCHREHRGQSSDLTSLSDEQCQTCHSVRFDSLANGHPAFSDYPYDDRLSLKYDHVSHKNKHFPEEDVTWQCNSCHMPDQAGQKMLTASFDKACAQCHLGEIQGDGRVGDKGIAVLRLPGLDVESLEARAAPVGEWPLYAEGRVTPFMRLLLSVEPGMTQALEELQDTDLLYLEDASDAEIAAVSKMVWGVKRLFLELRLQGHKALKARLESAVGREFTAQEIGSLAATMPSGAVAQAQQKWLPNLMQELAQRREGEPPPAKLAPEPPLPDETVEDLLSELETERERQVLGGGWYRSDYIYTLFYRPRGHGDPFMRAWLQLGSEQAGAKHGGSDTDAPSLFETLSDPDAPGRCIKCHSVERTDSGGLMVNWPAQGATPHQQDFTAFSHSSHFSLLHEPDGCATCHKLDPKVEFMDYFDDPDPSHFASSFKPMPKGTCTECHRSELAGSTCLTCHNYHVGNFTPAVLEPENVPAEPATQLED